MKLREEVFEIMLRNLSDYKYCILRNYDILPNYRNDIDILVEKNKIDIILKKIVDDFAKESVIFLHFVQFSCLSVYFYDKITNQFIHLDFFEEIKWKVFEYLSAKDILNSRILQNKIYIPHPLYEMYELLLTRLVYQGKIKEAYKEKIFWLFTEKKSEKILKSYYNFHSEIKNRRWDKIEKKLYKLRARIIIANFFSPITLIKSIFSFIYRVINRHIRPPGLFIAFYGVDGSGKSRQIQLLLDNIKGLFGEKINTFHFRPTLFYSKPKEVTISNPHAQKKTVLIRTIMKLFFYVIIYNWGYLTQILPMTSKNGLVIFDRYYFDLMIDPIRYRMKVSKKVIKFFGYFIPKPDINFALIAEPKAILNRKNELSLNEIIKQQDYITHYFTADNCYMIKTDIQESGTSNKIKNLIIEYVKSKN